MRKLKYKILSHTADLRLEVFGKTLEELFDNGVIAIADILHKRSETTNASESTKEIVKVESANLSALLVDFLNEVLAKSHIGKQVYKVKSLKLKGLSLEAELAGTKVSEFEEDIKAVTYHEVDIRQSEKFWHTKLVLDI